MSATWEFRSEIPSLQSHVGRFIEDALGRRRATDVHYDQTAFSPPVDIIEESDYVLIRAELPGVAKEDLEIHVENSVLDLRGEKRPDKDLPEDHYRRSEREYGRFARSFSLPRTVEAGKIEATFKDGILELKLPKAAAAMPRKIAVS